MIFEIKRSYYCTAAVTRNCSGTASRRRAGAEKWNCLVNSAPDFPLLSVRSAVIAGKKRQRDLPNAFKSCAPGSMDQCAAEDADCQSRDNHLRIQTWLMPIKASQHSRPTQTSYRTSFAPETTSPKINERDRTERKHSEINEADRYPVAHNGLVAGSSPAGPTKESITY